jgi:enamine deaminase RidA (YjgF/YER057c/UK114 family)
MAHVRLRKFNTKAAYPEQKLDNDLSMVVRAGNHIFLRGQTAMALDGSIKGIGDPAAQAENAMECAEILLKEAGASLKDVCKITIYITEREYREPVYRVVGRWLKGVYPVSTGLIVKGLAKPEYLMEIDIDAVIQEKSTKPSTKSSTRKPATGSSKVVRQASTKRNSRSTTKKPAKR